jgi:hypothetical protein
MVSPHGLHPLAFNYSRAFLRKRNSNESAVPISFFALAVRSPAHRDLATGAPTKSTIANLSSRLRQMRRAV